MLLSKVRNVLSNASALLGVGSDGLVFQWWLDLLVNGIHVRLGTRGLVHFSCSRDIDEYDDDDSADIVEATVVRGTMSELNVSGYGYELCGNPSSTTFWKIVISGTMHLVIVCHDVTIDQE